MKTIFLSAFLAITLLATASGTKDKTAASYKTSRSLFAEFGRVDNVKWSNAMNDMIKADFILDDEAICAFFDANGDFVASTKAVDFNELPKNLKTAINDKVPGANILTVFEFNSKTERAWFVETELNNEKKVWKGNGFGSLTRYYVKD